MLVIAFRKEGAQKERSEARRTGRASDSLAG